MDFYGNRKAAKRLEAELFLRLKGGKHASKYILCVGEGGYEWFTTYNSRKSTPNKVCRYLPLVDILEDSINEYIACSGKTIDHLSVTVETAEAIHKRFSDVDTTKHICAYKEGFFLQNTKIKS